MAVVEASKPSILLDHGIYDGREVARLVGRDPETVAGWAADRASGPALLHPHFGGLFSFLDLVSLHVVSELVERRVALDDIRRGALWLAERLGTDRPFAHQGLATVGRGFFADVGEWVDAGRGGQGAFDEVIEPLLRPITFGGDGLATRWQPHPHVMIDPRVQGGTPCVEGTRVPTMVVSDGVATDEDLDEVADDYGLTVDQVRAAVDYERQLAA